MELIKLLCKAIIGLGTLAALVERERAFAQRSRNPSLWSFIFMGSWSIITVLAII